MVFVKAAATPTEPPRIDTARLWRILRVLANIASAIARSLVERAQAGAPLHKSARGFVRVTRALRRMIMLAMQIGAPGCGGGSEQYAARKRRGRADDGVERPERDDDPEERPERPERGDRREFAYDMTDETLDSLIRGICRDLGLPPLDGNYRWTELTPAEIAALVLDAVGYWLGGEAARRARRAAFDLAAEMPVWAPAPGWGPRVPDG